ncbi:hypothetical protein CVT24_011760, partial [Panaeolus cyanescens]
QKAAAWADGLRLLKPKPEPWAFKSRAQRPGSAQAFQARPGRLGGFRPGLHITIQCCNSLNDVSNVDATNIAALIGVAVSDLTGQIGLQCNPVTVIGVGAGANCASAPVCCEKNFQNQLVGINCTPITVGA